MFVKIFQSLFLSLLLFFIVSTPAFAYGMKGVYFDGTNYSLSASTSIPDGPQYCILEDYGNLFVSTTCTVSNGGTTMTWPASTYTPEANHQLDHGYAFVVCTMPDCAGEGDVNDFVDGTGPYLFNTVPHGLTGVNFDGSNYSVSGITSFGDGTQYCILEDFGNLFVSKTCTISGGAFTMSWPASTYTPEAHHQPDHGYSVVLCTMPSCAGEGDVNDFVVSQDSHLFDSAIPTATPTPTPTATPTPTPTATPTATPTPTPIPQLTSLSPAHLWMSKAMSDLLLRVDVLAEVYKDSTLVSSGQLNSVNVGTFFGNMTQITIPFNTFSPVNFPSGSQLKVKVLTRNACSGSLDPNGTVTLFFNDSGANSRFDSTIGGTNSDFYLRNGFVLTPTSGTGPRQNVSVSSGSQCSAFKTFGTWTITP